MSRGGRESQFKTARSVGRVLRHIGRECVLGVPVVVGATSYNQVFAVASLVDALSDLIQLSDNWDRYLDTLDTYCSVLERGRELLWDVRGSPDTRQALVRRAEELEALHQAAVDMGRRGGIKGGRARALSLTAEQRSDPLPTS